MSATKVQTETAGDAFIEYAIEVCFSNNNQLNHYVKITAYATTCKVMLQPIGEKPTITHQHLGNRSAIRYFLDMFIKPWCENALQNNKIADIQSYFLWKKTVKITSIVYWLKCF